MYFQCVLILALSLVHNEAAERSRFSQRSGPGRTLRSGSPKRIQGSFDTAAELATLIQRVRKELVDEKDRLQFKPIEDTSPEDETDLQALFNVIQKKINDNEGIRIHVLKNADALDRYKKDLGSRAVFIDNPEVLAKYVKDLKKPKTADIHRLADFKNLMLQRRNAVFRLEDPDELLKPLKFQERRLRKRYEGGTPDEISKRFNKVTNKNMDMEREVASGKKPRDTIDRSREVRKPEENRGLKNERENRGYKNERENRGYKNMRENRGSNKQEFKDYPEFKKQGNPNIGQTRPSKVPDYDYGKPRKPKKSIPGDYDEGFYSKKGNKDKFDDYGQGKKKDAGWGQSMGSESRKKPVPKMDWDEKPKRNFDNNERRRPKNDDGWAPSIRGGSSDYHARSSKNNDGYGFGNTPIPFNRPRNIYVDEHGE